ncbi:uncharacterized protein LOC121424464 isoform X2 [Lytechinus variegatus]|uniref:uncharacterized protein LOC121424464 isoform X2 n=1 Tax=Lytechinus variegatus TaxID=7654 RepID=UPI001BB26B7D|nr:uncharacterized protein LOC121424464 isoform X2 [Lytechinus variegatus]
MNLSNTNGSLNASTIILDEEFEITIGQAWMPVVPLPILMLTSLSIFGCLIALVSSMQIVSEYLRIDPNHPQIDPKRNHHAIRYENMKEQHIPDGASYPSSPPSTGKLPRRGPRQNTNTNRSATQISPSPLLQRDHHSPPQPPGSPSKYRRGPDGQVRARESSSAPMIMNGLWKRIERVLKMGFDADTNSCQLSFVHHNNNSALRPSCSDSASLPFKRPMVFQADCTPSLIDSSIIQLTSTSCQTETSSSTFPRKIACRCCLDRQTGKSPLQKSSSSSLLRNMYLKNNNIGVLNDSHQSSSLLSETSNPGRPKLSIHDEDLANKLCLSVDERIRRYRLCYSSSSDDDSDE